MSERMIGAQRGNGVSPVRWAAAGALAVSLLLAGLSWVSASGGSSQFTPITPCRLVDSRSPLGQFDVPIGPAETWTFDTVGTFGECTIPAGVTALDVNLTSVSASTTTFFTLFPTGTIRPNSSHLNPNGTVPVSANTTVVTLSSGGQFSLYNDAGTSHVLIDVLGYHSPLGSTPTFPDVLYTLRDRTLGSVDTSTGSLTTVGPIPFEPAGGLSDGPSGSFISTHNDPARPGPELFSIDRSTASTSVIGPSTSLAGLAFDESGTLFGTDFFGNLFTVDTTTGGVSLVGPVGLPAGHVEDLSFAPDGTLYGAAFAPGVPAVSQLVTIDTSTGQGTAVASFSGNGSNNTVNGIAFDSTGTLYGTVCSGNGSDLVTIDPGTAVVTVIGNIVPIGCTVDLDFAPAP